MVELKEGFDTKVNGEVVTSNYADDNGFFASTKIPKKQIKEVFEHCDNYITSATNVAVKEAQKIFKKDSNINKAEIKFPYTPSKRGHIVVNVDRAVTKTNNFTKETTTQPYIKVEVKDPFAKISRDKVKELEGQLAKAIA